MNSENDGNILVFNKNNPRSCSYNDLLDYQPQSFFDTKGAISLSCLIELMEIVFIISSCTDDYHVIYATYMLVDSALTWWNNHTKSIGIDEACAITWEALKQMLTEECFP